jgi:triacylglycerol lipase
MHKSMRAAACVGVLLAGPALPASAAAHEPVLFVHGWLSSGRIWSTMIDRFEHDGWSDSELFSWSYDWHQSNEATARQLAAEVDSVRAATGAAKIDIVAHSMGGLSSRYYLNYLGGTANVDDWVSIGGPNHGTLSAYACWDRSCLDMRPGSRLLTRLNSGDETPGATRYGTVWSSCDEIILPQTSVPLSGATNVHVGCVGHVSLLFAPNVYVAAREFVRD